MQAPSKQIETWLRHFAKAVRNQDFSTGKSLFDQNVVSFGTVCFRADTFEDLLNKQWKMIWTSTEDFDFDYSSALVSHEGNQAVVIATWKSTGFDQKRKAFSRYGRVTIVLSKKLEDWKAIHTHFSLKHEK